MDGIIHSLGEDFASTAADKKELEKIFRLAVKLVRNNERSKSNVIFK